MVSFRKRTYGGSGGNRAFKRRRTTRKRSNRFRRARGKKTLTQTTQSATGRTLPFKSRKLSYSAYRKKLWDATLMKAHYRSCGAVSGSVVTTIGNTTWALVVTQAVDNGAGPFYTSAGGAQIIDTAVAVPVFQDDIIVRGGKAGMSLYNDSTDGPVNIWVFFIKCAPRPSTGLASLPVNPTVGFDPSMFHEFFKDIGKIQWQTEFMLEANAACTVERRLPVTKIDQEAWSADGQRWVWIVMARDLDPVSQNIVRILNYYNVSFSADST